MNRKSSFRHASWQFLLIFTLLVGIPIGSVFGFRPISVSKENVALNGYDTVAYFKEDRAVPGSAIYRIMWKGAYWHFSTKTNMRLFENNPEKYAPEYGGYCAYGIGHGVAVSCDPEAFLISGGKLYVMKNKEMVKIWEKDPEGYLAKAKKNWGVLTKAAD